MKIIITSIGTRGDMEPFLAIGEHLLEKGFEILYLFPAQFESLVDDKERFSPLSPEFLNLLDSDDGKAVMGKASFIQKIKSFWALFKKGMKVNNILIQEQFDFIEKENPDLVIHHLKCNYPLVWGMKHKRPTVCVSPIPYVIHCSPHQPHVGFNKNLGNFLNIQTYRFINFALIKTIQNAHKKLNDGVRFSYSEIKKELLTRKMAFTVSPTFYKRENKWGENVQIVGYHERNKMWDWEPSLEINTFLNKHKKVLFLTFGSMVNGHSEESSALIYQILDELNIPVIVNIAGGGLDKNTSYLHNEKFHFINRIPYDWILDKTYAIIHHGGSGTTHSSLKYGCASMIIPHIMDQHTWNTLNCKLGAGPKGPSINKLSYKKLKVLIHDLWSKPTYKANAITLSNKMKEESLGNELIDFLLSK